MKRLRSRPQRTLARTAEVRGRGFLTGANVRLRFLPAPPDSGLAFLRTDLRPGVRIPAHTHLVTGTARRTTLGHDPDHVMLVEHALAAVAGLRIDNCTIELDGPEPPGLDGSSRAFVEAILDAGIVPQASRRPVWTADRPVTVGRGGATLTLHPPDDGCDDYLRTTYFLDYGPNSPIGPHTHTLTISPETFAAALAPCRTFLLESEAVEFRKQGLGERLTPADLLVFGPHGLIDNRLHFADEPARHKLLDLIGDLALIGADLRGHLVAYRSGHPLNVELAQTLAAALAPTAVCSFRRAA